jgi:hypothetical protein
VPAKKRRSPQEKKRLSYSRDRRNSYGENDKSSRKNVARNKRVRHHADRRGQNALLAAGTGPVDEDVEMLLDERVTRRRRRDYWRKCPDTPLGLHVASSLKRRVDRGMSAAGTERARIEIILRNTSIDGMELSRQGWEWIATGPEPGSPGQMRWLRTMATVRASFLHPSRTRSEAPVAEKAD